MTARATERLTSVGAGLLCLGVFAISFYNTRHLTFLPPDAEHYAIVARNLLRGDGYTENFVPIDPGAYRSVRHFPQLHGLLRPLELVPLFRLLGVGPPAVRLPNLVYAVLTAMVVFWWAHRLFGSWPALLACALTVLNAELLLYALLATDDVGFAFWVVLSLALLHEALAHSRDGLLLLAGVAAGLALLEKPSGFFIAAVFVTALWRFGGPGRGRRFALAFAPFLAATSVYLVRNYLAYGSPQFRFGVLVWAYKTEGYEGYARLYDRLPSLLGMLETIGWRRVGSIIADELGKLLATLFPVRALAHGILPPLSVGRVLPTLAACGVLLQLRRAPIMTWLVLAATLASAAFICVLHHFQMRYFSFLFPLFALSAAALLAVASRTTVRGWPGLLLRGGAAVVGVCLVVASAVEFAGVQALVRTSPDLRSCADGIAWVAANTGPGDRILTFDPWTLDWVADREAIMIPSGGVEPIAVVARRYDAHWLLAYETALRPVTSKLVMALDEGTAGLRLTTRFDDGRCRVARLDWEPDAAAP